MNLKTLAAAVILVGNFSACKPKAEDGSSVASLDNLTRGADTAVATNFCGIKMTKAMAAHLSANDRRVIDKRIDTKSDELRYAVAGSLTAVPKIMQAIFFATPGGRIQVVSDVQSKCAAGKPSAAAARFFAESQKNGRDYQLDGCWSVEGKNLMIYIKDDPKVIHHGLLRIFAAAYAEFFTARLDAVQETLPAKYKTELKSGMARFKRQKAQLVTAFFADLDLGDAKTRVAFQNLRKDDPRALATQVFAETIDSAYCSAASNYQLEAKFKHVAAVVNEGPDALRHDFGEPAP